MSTLKSHQHVWVERDTVRQQTRACCYERLLEDLDCLECKVLAEVDSPRLTQGYEEKHGVLAPVDVLKHMKKLKELLARGKETQKRKKEKRQMREKKEPLLLFFYVKLDWNVECDSTFYIHLVNTAWNSDCSYFRKCEIQVEHFICCQCSRAMKDYWVDAKWARTRTRVWTALSENNYRIVLFVSTHPRTKCTMSYFIFRARTTVHELCNGLKIRPYPV